MAITANQVKELRTQTGAGMMDCKKALQETGGDLAKAVDFLREKGLAAAAKKAGRIAAEGAVVAAQSSDGTTGCIVEVNSETDLVAKNDLFRTFAAAVAEHILAHNPADVTALLAQPMADGRPVADHVTEQITTIGENLAIRRFARYGGTGKVAATYIHMQGKIGVLVEMEGAGAARAVEVGRDIAMHIAASNPLALSRADVPAAEVEHERQIYTVQARESGKPEKVIDKMVTGRLEKFFAASCLLEQPFVKDPDLTVHQLLAARAKELGGPIVITRFTRFALGEGLEKRHEDFASEVAAQLR